MKQTFGSSNQPRSHRGPGPDEIADSEVLTILLVAELCQVHRDAAWLRQVRRSHASLFPHLPEDCRFWRRAQRVRYLLGQLRRAILFWADADLEPIRIFDSFPMPLCACYRIRQSSQPISGSSFGYNSSKRQYYFGLHPGGYQLEHGADAPPGLVTTDSGYIQDIILAPGYCFDTSLLAATMDQYQEMGISVASQDWVLDKGFYSKPLA